MFFTCEKNGVHSKAKHRCVFRAKNSGLLKRLSALACSLQRHRFASDFADIQKKIKMR